MNPFQSSILIFFAIIIYIIAIDRNVEDFIILKLKLMKINVERLIWIIKFHPRNPITNYIQAKKYEKLAKELHNEIIKNDE